MLQKHLHLIGATSGFLPGRSGALQSRNTGGDFDNIFDIWTCFTRMRPCRWKVSVWGLLRSRQIQSLWSSYITTKHPVLSLTPYKQIKSHETHHTHNTQIVPARLPNHSRISRKLMVGFIICLWARNEQNNLNHIIEALVRTPSTRPKTQTRTSTEPCMSEDPLLYCQHLIQFRTEIKSVVSPCKEGKKANPGVT